MSWHVPLSGPELFCVLSGLEAAGGRESSFQLPLSLGGCQLSPLLTQGKTGRPKFLRMVVPTTGEGPVGSSGPAYWAKGSNGTTGSSQGKAGLRR